MKIPEEIRKYKKLLTNQKGKKVYNHYVSLLRLFNKDISGNGLIPYSSVPQYIERDAVKNLFLFYVRQILGDKYEERGYLSSIELFSVIGAVGIIFDEKIGDIVMEGRFHKPSLGGYLDSFFKKAHKFKGYIENGKPYIYIRVPAKDIAKLYTPLVNLSNEYFKLIGLVEQETIREDTRRWQRLYSKR